VKVLVTGGMGFIGSNLVLRLLRNGDEVRVLDDLSTGHEANLEDVGGDYELIVGDLRDRTVLARSVTGADVVYHLGALPSVARSVADPVASHEVNATGTLNVLSEGRDAGVRRVVYASSSSIYGDTPVLPKHEDMPVNTMSPYAASKLTGEAYCRAFSRSMGLETVSLRFFNVFGPRQDPASHYAAVIPAFLSKLGSGEPPVIFGDGYQSRDFTYIENVVDACLQAAGATAEAVGEVFNIGCGGRTTLLELVASLREIVASDLEPLFDSPRPGDVRHSEADISKARRLLGYEPRVSLYEGLRETTEWFRDRFDSEFAARRSF
jgi:UDP-glucose 4-epimerase